MIARYCFLFVLLAGLVATDAQNKLFSTSTTSPTAPKVGTGPRPIDVLANGGGTFTMSNGLVTYLTNVRVNDPQFFLRCESLRLFLDLKGVAGTKQPPEAAKLPALMAPMGGLIREVDATGGILFSNKADGSYALAERGRYFATNDAFELTGNAQMVKKFGGDNAITNSAPRIMFFRAQGEFVLFGETSTGASFTPAKTNAPAKNP